MKNQIRVQERNSGNAAVPQAGNGAVSDLYDHRDAMSKLENLVAAAAGLLDMLADRQRIIGLNPDAHQQTAETLDGIDMLALHTADSLRKGYSAAFLEHCELFRRAKEVQRVAA